MANENEKKPAAANEKPKAVAAPAKAKANDPNARIPHLVEHGAFSAGGETVHAKGSVVMLTAAEAKLGVEAQTLRAISEREHARITAAALGDSVGESDDEDEDEGDASDK